MSTDTAFDLLNLVPLSPRNSDKPSAVWSDRQGIERRQEERFPVSYDARIFPLKYPGQEREESFPGKIINISTSGLCLEHEELLVEQYVQVEWFLKDKLIEALVHLRWCRSDGTGIFHSGGRVISVER